MRILIGDDPLEVSPGDTVMMLRDTIESKMGFPATSSYTLTSHYTRASGTPVHRILVVSSADNEKTLGSLGITDGERLFIDLESKQMVYSWDTRRRVHIKLPGGTYTNVFINNTDTIDDIKRTVVRDSLIPEERLTLTFEGGPLDSHKTLAECGIEAESGPVKVLKAVIKDETLMTNEEKEAALLRMRRNVVEGSENALSYDDIQEGNMMVNFPRRANANGEGRRTEYNFGKYYKDLPSIRALRLNPETRHPLTPSNFTRYIAHLVPRGGSKQSRRRTRKRTTRRRR